MPPPRSTTSRSGSPTPTSTTQAFAEWNAAGNADNVYVRSAFTPLEEADSNPATQQYIDIVDGQRRRREPARRAGDLRLPAVGDRGQGVRLDPHQRLRAGEARGRSTAGPAAGSTPRPTPAPTCRPTAAWCSSSRAPTYVRDHPDEVNTYDCDPSYVVKVSGAVVDAGQPRRRPDLPTAVTAGAGARCAGPYDDRMQRPTKFEHNRWVGDKRSQVVYDVDNIDDPSIIEELMAAPRPTSASGPTASPRPATAATSRTRATAAGPRRRDVGPARWRSSSPHRAASRSPGTWPGPGSRRARCVPGLVISHGFPHMQEGGRLSARSFPELAERIATEMGWMVLVFTFRGCGDSEGDFSLLGWLDDLLAAAAFLRGTEGCKGVW